MLYPLSYGGNYTRNYTPFVVSRPPRGGTGHTVIMNPTTKRGKRFPLRRHKGTGLLLREAQRRSGSGSPRTVCATSHPLLELLLQGADGPARQLPRRVWREQHESADLLE
jgi:hypothetical protein